LLNAPVELKEAAHMESSFALITSWSLITAAFHASAGVEDAAPGITFQSLLNTPDELKEAVQSELSAARTTSFHAS
jgi:hypothetical protein